MDLFLCSNVPHIYRESHEILPLRQTALHMAAENNLPSICSVLLQNGVDFAAVDNRGNNALHAAVKEGHINVVRALLTESQIDAEAFNNKGN